MDARASTEGKLRLRPPFGARGQLTVPECCFGSRCEIFFKVLKKRLGSKMPSPLIVTEKPKCEQDLCNTGSSVGQSFREFMSDFTAPEARTAPPPSAFHLGYSHRCFLEARLVWFRVKKAIEALEARATTTVH
jgi:hypothetical protein